MKFEGTIPKLRKDYQSIKLSKFNNGHWLFPEQMGGEEYAGFIYVIRDSILERFYLGKKTYRTASGANKGKESDWKNYKSSSKVISHLLKERPFDEFDFIVLEQYKTKGTLSYSETWTLCLVEAPTNITWYNTRVEKVSWPVKEPISIRHKTRLEDAIRFLDFSEER